MYITSKILHHSGCLQSYGENCQYPCSKNCVNQTCDRFHGICQFGCETGYIGQKCEQGIYTCMWILTRNMFTDFLKIHTTDQHYLCKHIKFYCVLFLEYPSSSCLSTLSSGFTGASISACVLITTAVVIFMIR